MSSGTGEKERDSPVDEHIFIWQEAAGIQWE